MLEAHGFGVRHIYRISQLLFFSALCLWVLDIGSRIFGLQFLRTAVTGGGSSLQTELLLIPLFVAVYALPALRRKKLPRVCAALTLAYSAFTPMLSMDVVVELWLAEETQSYGLWTAHSTFLSVALISISILLLQTKLQILGATVAFVASITPLHLVLTYVLAPGYLDHHTPMSTALILVLLSAAVLLRFCTRSTFRKFFTRSIRSLNLISVGLLGIVIQQSLVLFDLCRGIDTNDLELLIVSLPLQYLLFSYVNNQVNSYRSIVKYGKRMHRNATLDPLTKCGNR